MADKLWTETAVAAARQSALPVALASVAEYLEVEVEVLVDAVAACLLALTADESARDDATRAALTPILESYAAAIDCEAAQVADAVIGALSWAAPDPKTHILDSWQRR